MAVSDVPYCGKIFRADHLSQAEAYYFQVSSLCIDFIQYSLCPLDNAIAFSRSVTSNAQNIAVESHEASRQSIT